MHHLIYITIGVTVACLVGLLTLFYSGVEKRVATRRLLKMTEKRALDGRRVPRWRSLASSRLTIAKQWVAKLPVSYMRDPGLGVKLAAAGFRRTDAVDVFLVARVFAPVAGLIAACFSPWYRALLLILLPSVGYLAPDLVLRRIAARRRERIRTSLPDAIDLMVICVESGLGMDQALSRVSQELELSHPEVADELVQVNLEQRAGKPRIKAWQSMAERLEIPEVTSFLNMLIQTDRFGTPIGRALSAFAENLRERRRQAAEEKAAKTTVKIIVPLALFIFPSIFVILLGPAVLTLFKNLPALGR